MKKLILIGMVVVFISSGCTAFQTKTEKGAAGGAMAGQAIGRDTKGTVLSAVDGTAPGVGVDLMMDRQEAEMRDALAASEAAAIRREGELLAITLKGDVRFDLDSDAVQFGLYNELDRIAQIMIKYPQTTILVEGHTDGTGSDTYNLQLSERRAKSVKFLLVQRGVQIQRIKIIGYGEGRPVATNATAEGRQMNRRVEIRISPVTL